MLKYLKEFSHADAQAFCKNHYNEKLINPCTHCPVYKLESGNKYACVFKAKYFVMEHMNMMLDDGSITDADLKFWQK